jgi:hypothetical protein
MYSVFVKSLQENKAKKTGKNTKRNRLREKWGNGEKTT